MLGNLNKILVPLDFSEASLEALRVAAGLAADSGARLTLLTVVDTSFPYPELFSFEDPGHDYFHRMREGAMKRMGEALAAWPGVAAEKVVLRGKARVEIAAFARESGADLIVLTNHGAGGFAGSRLGGTADAVIRQTPCPVLVLPIAKDHASPVPIA